MKFAELEIVKMSADVVTTSVVEGCDPELVELGYDA